MPLQKGVWDKYGGYFQKRRQEGATLQEIANEVGRSKERIRQILVRHYGSTEILGLLSSRQLASWIGVSECMIYSLARKGIITPACASPRRLWRFETAAALREVRKCDICNAYLPPGRIRYCSSKCGERGAVKARFRGNMRTFYRKRGYKITPHLFYVKSPSTSAIIEAKLKGGER